MLKIYFTASTSYDGDFHFHYREIIRLLKKNGCQILSGTQIINQKLFNRDAKLKKTDIFKRETKLIQMADCVVAEVTKPSHGVGGEIVFALTQTKPVLGLIYNGNENKISPMLTGNPSDNLFLESYTVEQLPYKVRNFIKHINNLKKRKGKLIVIDGGNGSGKTTQTQLLTTYFKNHKIPVKLFDFPQYYSSFHGKTIAKFLRGEFGTLDQVSPYLASLAFAVDRASVKQEMNDLLVKGNYIVTNRYATSNLAHQAAKFTDSSKQREFISWIYDLEYKVHKIPKENIVIYLHVPVNFGKKLTAKKGERAYLKGQSEDIEEKDHNYRVATEKMYLQLAKHYKHWHTINCVENNNLLSPDTIHQKIISTLQKEKIIDN